MTSWLNKSEKETQRQPVRHRSRRLASWAIIATLFLNTLSAIAFPSLSSGVANAAFPQTENEDVLVICTPNGLRFIRLDADGEPAPTENTDTGYCAFCQPFNHPILTATATATVTSAYGYTHIQQPISCEADQDVTSLSLGPLGSRAPPVFSL